MPVVIRSVVGAGGRFGAIHSQMPASWFMGVPGIKIAAPVVPADAKALLRAAIDDDNPVLFFEHKRLYGVEGDVERRARRRSARRTSCARAATSRSSRRCAACTNASRPPSTLAAAGIDAEVDRPAHAAPARPRHHPRLAREDEPHRRRRGGPAHRRLGRRGARARAPSDGLGDIDDAWRITTPDTPIPYSPPLEDAHLPGADAHRRRDRRRLA